MRVLIIAIILCFSLSGCGIIPKDVEYFQKKVEAVPESTVYHQERKKQAAEFIDRKTGEALSTAIKDNSSTNVLEPIKESKTVAKSLTGSLGKPLDKWYGDGIELAYELDVEDALLDLKLEDYKARNEELVGKKIEGSGLFQISYFSNILLIGGLIFGLYFAFRIISVLNPGINVGTKLVTGGIKTMTKLAGKGFSQTLIGSENFKKKLDSEIEDIALRNRIKQIFRETQQAAQDEDVQKIIKDLTQ